MLNRSSGLPVLEIIFLVEEALADHKSTEITTSKLFVFYFPSICFARLENGMQKVTKANSSTSGNDRFYHDCNVSYLTKDIAYCSGY